MILRKQTDRSTNCARLLWWSLFGSLIVEVICFPAGLIKQGINRLWPFGLQKSILGYVIWEKPQIKRSFCMEHNGHYHAGTILVKTAPFLEYEIAVRGNYIK